MLCWELQFLPNPTPVVHLEAKETIIVFKSPVGKYLYVMMEVSLCNYKSEHLPPKRKCCWSSVFGILDSIKNQSPAFSFKVRVTLWLPGEHTKKTVLKTESLDSVSIKPQGNYLSSVSLSFLICKMQKMRLTSLCCNNEYISGISYFTCEEPIVNVLGFEDHMVFVTIIQFCQGSKKADT